MPPKGKKAGKGGAAAAKAKKPPAVEFDYAADENFKPNEPLVHLEYDRRCFVYREQAELFAAQLGAAFPERTFHVLANLASRVGELGPRDGSFEIWFAQNARCAAEQLWTGVQKGPPRRLKFPADYAELFPAAKRIMARYFKVPSAEKVDEAEEEEVAEG